MLAAALDNNATLTSLDLDGDKLGAQGARLLAAALDNTAMLTSLNLASNRIGCLACAHAAASQGRGPRLAECHCSGVRHFHDACTLALQAAEELAQAAEL